MTGPLLLGALFGIGVITALAWRLPARPSLAQTLAALHPPVPSTFAGTSPPGGVGAVPAGREAGGPDGTGVSWAARLGRPAVPLLVQAGLPRRRVHADLAVCGRDPARHLAEQATAALLTFLAAPAVVGVLTLAGAGIGWQLPVWVALLAAAAGLFLPDLVLRSRAAARRAELRDAVAGMLDLVTIALAGGAGIEQALREATDHPDTWAQHALRHAVEAAHLTRCPPWQTLGDLARTTGVTALQELSAALCLAGTEGARIKATLSARSAALNAHQLADAEAAAVTATEAMVLPVVVLLAGFLLFLGYPAFAAVLHAL